MTNPEEFKKKIKDLLMQDYSIEFLGEKFGETVKLLTDKNANSIYDWISRVIKKEIQPIFIGSDKTYKDWKLHELLTFRYAFNINNSEYRILFVKVKNSFYIEFHLGDHKYYDRIRKDLNMTNKKN